MGSIGEHTHYRVVKLSRISGARFAEKFEASLQCNEGQRSATDDLIQGREYSNREAASYQGSAEANRRDAEGNAKAVQRPSE